LPEVAQFSGKSPANFCAAGGGVAGEFYRPVRIGGKILKKLK